MLTGSLLDMCGHSLALTFKDVPPQRAPELLGRMYLENGRKNARRRMFFHVGPGPPGCGEGACYSMTALLLSCRLGTPEGKGIKERSWRDPFFNPRNLSFGVPAQTRNLGRGQAHLIGTMGDGQSPLEVR